MHPNVDNLVGTLRSSRSGDECLDALAQHLAGLGFPRVAYTYVVAPRDCDGTLRPPPIEFRNFPARWQRDWSRVNRSDPFYKACFSRNLPLNWACFRKETVLTPAEHRACELLEDHGMNYGFTVPIHLPNGAFAGMSAIWRDGGDEREWLRDSARTLDQVFLAAHHFHFHLQAHQSGQHRTPAVHLTPRECEVLQWAAAGKSAPEIAILLGCSVQTVHFHFKNLKTKLNAANRVQAAVKAVQLGLVACN